MTHMSFGRALELLRTGHRLRRFSWKDRDAYLVLQSGFIWHSYPGGRVQHWNMIQEDILAEDWGTCEESHSPMDLSLSGDGDQILADNRTLRDPAA
jgi:hypothetical protein